MLQRAQVNKLAKSPDAYVKDIYSIVRGGMHGDSIKLSSSNVEEISSRHYEQVKANYTEKGMKFESLDEARASVHLRLAGDMLGNLENFKNGVGTMLDPSMYTHSTIPVMLGPYEGSSVYAQGGLPKSIIDKKARAMIIDGVTFKGFEPAFWTQDRLQKLEDAAEITGFNDKCSDGICSAFIYGGDVLYPVFDNDTVSSYAKPLDKIDGKITRWVDIDRWNICIVPSYIITAKDYLQPDSIFIPQGGIEVSTSRCALIKPTPMPYWIALYNLGWAPSDFAGWIRQYFGYQITQSSIYVMAQQLSLILYKLPLDALNATLGVDKVKQLMQINEEKMAEWSTLHPKAVNMVGDVEVVNRTYSGFSDFVEALKSDLAAHAEIPEPSLWHTPNKGFSDNTTESLLKQSETLQMKQRFIERSMTPCTEALIIHTFGRNSEEYKHKDTVRMTFAKPVISTERDLAEAGARLAASVSSFAAAGVSPDMALKMCAQFFPTVKYTDKDLAEIKSDYEKQLERNSKMGQNQGNTLSSSAGKNTGKLTK